MGTKAKSEAPDEMQHNAAFHQGLPLLRYIRSSGTEVHDYLRFSTCELLEILWSIPSFFD